MLSSRMNFTELSYKSSRSNDSTSNSYSSIRVSYRGKCPPPFLNKIMRKGATKTNHFWTSQSFSASQPAPETRLYRGWVTGYAV
jgi:hypothetical protein